LDILHGLPYFKLRYPTDEEMENLPHVISTSDIEWDPRILGYITNKDTSKWYPDNDESQEYGNHNFNEFKQYCKCVLNQCESLYNYVSDSRDLEDVIENVINYKYNNASTTTNDIDYEPLSPPFGFVLIEIFKKTFKVTTQYAHTLTLYNDMRKHYMSTLMLRKEMSLLQRILFIQTMQQ
jgi:oligoendopeptidase F